MPAKNTISDKPVTHREMVNYIGPIFEDLKTEIHLKFASKSDLKELKREIDIKFDSQTREFGVILESTKNELIGALETFFAVSAKREVVAEHEERISTLETEMVAVKSTLTSSK